MSQENASTVSVGSFFGSREDVESANYPPVQRLTSTPSTSTPQVFEPEVQLTEHGDGKEELVEAKNNKTRSFVWKYFKRLDKTSSKCLTCTKKYACADYNTTGMRKHLRSKHPIQWANMQKQIAEERKQLNANWKEAEKIFDGDEEYEYGLIPNGSPRVLARSIKKRKLTGPTTPTKLRGDPEEELCIRKFTKLSPSDRRQLRFDLELMKLLARNNLPFSFVDTPAFRDFMLYVDARFHIKHSTTFAKYKLPILYETVRSAVIRTLDEDLKDCSSLAISSDTWTSRTNEAYQSLTLHYISKEWVLKKFVLSVSLFTGHHTGERLAEKITELMDIVPHTEKLKVICVHDSAANMKLAVKRSKTIDESLPCADHLLQLALKDAVEACRPMKAIVDKCSKLASKSHKSSLMQGRIQREVAKQTNPESGVAKSDYETYKKIITPVATRWNSVVMMIGSILAMKRTLSRLRDAPPMRGDDYDFDILVPTDEEFALLTEVLDLLQTVQKVSEAISADKVCTLHLVMVQLLNLHGKCIAVEKVHTELMATDKESGNQNAFDFANCLRFEIDSRFPNFGADVMAYAMGNIFNPLYKGEIVIKVAKTFDETYKQLILDHDVHKAWLDDRQRQAKALPPVNSPGMDVFDVSAFEMIAQLSRDEEEEHVQHAQRVPDGKSPIQLEWEKYKSMSRPYIAGYSILDWWKNQEPELPLLAMLARFWLCAPASSASSERAFSAGGNVVSYKRTRLQPENVDKLIFLQQNLTNVHIRRYNLQTSAPEDEPKPKSLPSRDESEPEATQSTQPGEQIPSIGRTQSQTFGDTLSSTRRRQTGIEPSQGASQSQSPAPSVSGRSSISAASAQRRLDL